ncbi:BA14K family protein [Phyllobacterium ifriqiyense]|uniref:BA14K family protein n=1 Tax=Phyllobacterium ifriqiyense TaxID=314238 RepID=UPI00349817D7
MNKTIASFGASVLLLLVSAAPASSSLPHRLPVVLGSDSIIQAVTHRHGFIAVRGIHYYNGYRGVVVARPGYRFYRGFWFPPAAFATGVIIDRTLTHPVPMTRPVTGAHIEWCFAHYRSYRTYDNTFQPYSGPRQQCWSPYN